MLPIRVAPSWQGSGSSSSSQSISGEADVHAVQGAAERVRQGSQASDHTDCASFGAPGITVNYARATASFDARRAGSAVRIILPARRPRRRNVDSSSRRAGGRLRGLSRAPSRRKTTTPGADVR